MKTKKEKLLAIFARNPMTSIEDAMRRTGASRPLAYRARSEARDQVLHLYEREGPNDPLDEEDQITETLTARGDKYGPFIGHAEISRALKNVIRFYTVERKGSFQNIDADMAEALEMIAHKIARIINGDHNYADSWVDIAGYAKLVADRLQGVTR
jgi:predicted S18 family serine protease